ncbi:transmembrane protein 127-like isoform X1 [Argiope bruennichi]|uniref:Transmembrane protein 127 like protein n=1 Tax=Argiope bruennichi TaxID=94029 RepID=A0A8T0FKK9_ARGBR|nr:transmembrane protein 127-like isoform X1 [Argiope bruennichi]XP_055929781.1 transmembrane protein 127-like isoform X1 [Argiope bruennichi]KAF8790079.1 Transmembrane protein 127 like protein [Argiope bruennichi]
MHSVIPASFVSQASRRNSTERERNIIAAIFSAKVIVLLIMALALPNWYYLKGGGCTRQVLGTEQFFYVSSVGTLTVPADGGNISYSKLAYYGLNEDMKDCLTPEIVAVQRIIIGLCFITIFFSFSQFYFDISGVKNNSLKCTRRCGLGSILSVIMIVIIIGLCYYVSDMMEQQQELTKLYPATRVEVTFGVSYYLIATAGVAAVLAAASNLFRCDHLSGSADLSMLVDDNQEEETFSIALPHSQSWSHIHQHNGVCISNLPPPPPYSP